MARTNRNGPPTSKTDLSSPDVRRIIEDYNKLRASQGLAPVSTIKYTRTIRLSNEAHENLVTIAANYGYFHDGKGNLSKLMEMIGLGHIATLPPGVDVDESKLDAQPTAAE